MGAHASSRQRCEKTFAPESTSLCWRKALPAAKSRKVEQKLHKLNTNCTNCTLHKLYILHTARKLHKQDKTAQCTHQIHITASQQELHGAHKLHKLHKLHTNCTNCTQAAQIAHCTVHTYQIHRTALLPRSQHLLPTTAYCVYHSNWLRCISFIKNIFKV